jgi:competence protein ComFA
MQLVRNEQPLYFSPKEKVLTWSGQLTSLQQEVSTDLVQSFKKGRSRLVHAVTGAGKTEITYQVIAACLKQGERVAFAAPRIDVVNELFPRLTAAFQVECGCYHGKSQPLGNEQLIVATTHQLLKFYHAFDLLILDEVDAFPFRGNAVLNYAAQACVKKQAVTIYLTATPEDELLKKAQQGLIDYSCLKRRYHGHLLPEPRCLYVTKRQLQHPLPGKVQKIMGDALAQARQLLFFVPDLSLLPQFYHLFKKLWPNKRVATVHANDWQRIEKITAFRKGQLDLLVTTTILERGVTFPGIWVIVWQAEAPIFLTSTLVQIAGRVGRSATDPDGLVLFCHHLYSKEMRQAVAQIKYMNR